ncbi:peptide deformylase [Methylovirgula ligni]|uniref:Peptide deformylase n=2 Tax=Methylovirgula ligni TaxID=569860 RepID=A0A3D9YXU6_9HYPH|nr:peptide deformylase [Methylovirgula ligni]
MPMSGASSPDLTSAMPLRPILILPDKRLREKAAPVTAVDDEIRALMDDMLETMYAAPGIGLAATQIGEIKRVLVLDVAKRQDEDASANPLVFANPEILWASEELSTYNEGCLSIPEIYEEVERPARIRVGYLDRDNKRQEIEAEGILATCLQHEIDHLNGVLFIDHISRLKREMISKKFSKAAKRGAADARHDNDDEAETRQAGLEG